MQLTIKVVSLQTNNLIKYKEYGNTLYVTHWR
nr:MAG TPA: hypothetical protein [Bacteriophage sp.]DAG99574.1 MAG TPA: hypothetical protein [Crassvirales sp.]DAM49362.1 MAG TPA: hypothetical protein [Crassvirales sp.]DAO16808.1 MAG TPA: hypothetical protein [Crassvirales sp.]